MNENCEFCRESKLNIADKTNYGASIIFKIGDFNNGWFATLSPKTGGDPDKDFTIQIMPINHLSHISEISLNDESSKNYGIIFSKIAKAINSIMVEEERNKENEEDIIRIGTYGKSKHLKEHFHIKLFPWAGDIGQPYTVDSSFEKSKIYIDPKTGEEFIKMKPVNKRFISKERHDYLTNKFILLLK